MSTFNLAFRLRRLFLVGTLLSSWPQVASATKADYLMFQNYARQAQDAQISAGVHADAVNQELSRAQYEYDLNRRLVDTGVGTVFELSKSLLKLIDAQLSDLSVQNEKANKAIQERVWRLRAGWALDDAKEDPRALALLYVDMRTEILNYTRRVVPYAERTFRETQRLYAAESSLYQQHAVSYEEYQFFITLWQMGSDFLESTRNAAAKAEEQLAEAKHDVEVVSP